MKYTVAYISIFAALTGCSEEPYEDIERVVTSTLLSATWTSECVVDGTNSYIPTLVFTTSGGVLYNEGTGSSSNVYHTDDTTCASAEPETVDLSTFTYTLGEVVIVDGSVEDITEATELNTVNTTEGSVDLGAEEYDIFAIKDKYTLYFGNKEEPNNGTTADLRPTQLSDGIIYSRLF